MTTLRSIQNRITSLNEYFRRIYVNIFNISILHCKFYGVKLKLHLKNDVDKRLFLYGFEKDIIRCFRKLIKKDDVVLDIGANIGIYSLIASESIGKIGRIYAFEPANIAYSSLLYNIKLNRIDNIYPIKAGVSDHSGRAIFNICHDDAYNSLGEAPLKQIIKSETIDLMSIDDFVINYKIAKVNVIKVDTEGAEYLVFKGAHKTLNKHKPILFFEHNPIVTKGFSNSTHDLIELIRFHGYELFEIKNGNLVRIEKDSTIIASEIIGIKK